MGRTKPTKKKRALKRRQQLDRMDWIGAALRALEEKGVDGIKIVVIAEQLGATSGSFYWHFSGLRDLLDSVLEYWELKLTDEIILAATRFDGPPDQRILELMIQVIESDAAAPDHAISVWARSDPTACEVFQRTLKKRFEFAAWMFQQAGMTRKQANARGRLMVAYLMGESSTALKANRNWKSKIKQQFEFLIT